VWIFFGTGICGPFCGTGGLTPGGGGVSEEVATVGGVGERVPVPEAARRYGAAPRTVKRWKATGKEKGDRCPLEDPVAMVAWWQRTMVQRVPDGIWAAVRAVQGDSPGPLFDAAPEVIDAPVVVDDSPVAETYAEPAPAEGEDEILETGLEVELGNLERLAARLAKKAHEPGQTKPYLDTLARIGALSRSLREEAEKLGKLVPKEMVEDVLRGLHASILTEFRGMYRGMCEACGLVMMPASEARWNAMVDELCERLGGDVLS